MEAKHSHKSFAFFFPSMFLMGLAGIKNGSEPSQIKGYGWWNCRWVRRQHVPWASQATEHAGNQDTLSVQNAGFYSSPGSITAWGVLVWDLLPHSREVIHKSQSWACKNTSHVSTISQGLTVGSDFRWITLVCLGEHHMVFKSCDSLHGNTNPVKS